MARTAVVQALSTVLCIAALTLLMIAVSTEEWQKVHVASSGLLRQEAASRPGTGPLVYYSRNVGLFRVCFPGAPKELDLVPKKPHETCIYQELEIPQRDDGNVSSDEYWKRVHMLRATIALLLLSILFLIIALVIGVVGCWKLSALLMQAAGILVLLAVLFGSIAMGLWHGAEIIEYEKIQDSPTQGQLDFPRTWTQRLRDNTQKIYGYSYILTWIALVLALISGVTYIVSAFAIKRAGAGVRQKRQLSELYSPKTPQYPQPPALNNYSRAPIMYALDSNYLRRQPFAYPTSSAVGNGMGTYDYGKSSSNSWGWYSS